MGLDMRVCPKYGDTLHPLGFTHHVKKCNGTRRKYNILMRSKVCSVFGISMNRESIPRHEAMCRARRDALNPSKLVKSRIPEKRPLSTLRWPTGWRPWSQGQRENRKEETRWQRVTRCAEKRRELLPMDGPLNANTVATASQRRSTFTRVKRPHGLSGPKE